MSHPNHYRSPTLIRRAWLPDRWPRYWPCSALKGQWGDIRYGWFATGRNVPEAGRIHWGFGGRLRAWCDVIRLSFKHGRAAGGVE